MKLKAALAVISAAFLFSAVGFAQSNSLKQHLAQKAPSGLNGTEYFGFTFGVSYIRQANAMNMTDTVELIDPGTDTTDPLYALIYVIAPDEELDSCCSCPLTPGQMAEITVTPGFTNNSAVISGGVVHNGTLVFVSSTNGNPSTPTPVPELVGWVTHWYTRAGTGYHDQNQILAADLNPDEMGALASTCGDYQRDLSGIGICTCNELTLQF